MNYLNIQVLETSNISFNPFANILKNRQKPNTKLCLGLNIFYFKANTCTQHTKHDKVGLERKLPSLFYSSPDGYLDGVCSANMTSGCFDSNAECRESVCQCVQNFTDINGKCKAGKLA